MATNNTSNKPGITAKELALYVGVPVATLCVAGGIYYYYTKKPVTSDGEKKSVKQENESTPVAIVSPQVASPESTVSEEPEDPLEVAQSSKSRGNKFFKAGRFEDAIKCYTKALELCPKEKVAEISTFYQNRAAAHEQLKQWQEVVNDCTEALQQNPRYVKALSRRARAQEALGHKRSCLEDVTATCILEGFQNQSSLILADRILKTFGAELAAEYMKVRPHVLPSSTFVKSYLDSFSEDVFAAGVPTEEELAVADTVYCKIIQKMKNKEYEGLIDLCTEEIEKDGDYKMHSYLLRGTLYTLMCDIEKAMADFNKVLEVENNDSIKKLKVDALIKRGSLKMQQAKDKECYADFQLAIDIDSDNANIYHHRGQLYFLTERLEDGRKEFTKSISLDAKFVAPRIQLGYCLCKIGMQTMQPSLMNEANKMLDETTQLFPDSSEAWSLFGQLLQEQQKFDEALVKLEKAITLAPKNPTTYVYKAILMLQWKSDMDAAVTFLRKAIELDDKCDFAYETLATLEVQKGNSENAVKLFEKALDLVRTEAEMASTFSLLEAAKAQTKIAKELGIKLPGAM